MEEELLKTVEKDYNSSYQKWKILTAGAFAGLIVDTSLFPIDTMKSRLQSKQGFAKAGGFFNLYRGIIPIIVCSVPNAAIFFASYETSKQELRILNLFGKNQVPNQMIAALVGEFTSCCFKVPFEVVKIKAQTCTSTNTQLLRSILETRGIAGLYKGFVSTVARELPFSLIQMPIWEQLKSRHLRKHNEPVNAKQSALYGSIGGAIAAFLTNPLDVAKTRIMLADANEPISSGKVLPALNAIWKEKRFHGLFAGVTPRVIWISLGGAIFFGSYEEALKLLKNF